MYVHWNEFFSCFLFHLCSRSRAGRVPRGGGDGGGLETRGRDFLLTLRLNMISIWYILYFTTHCMPFFYFIVRWILLSVCVSPCRQTKYEREGKFLTHTPLDHIKKIGFLHRTIFNSYKLNNYKKFPGGSRSQHFLF